MRWTVDDIYKLVKFLSRKNQSGSISASDLFYLWNTEQNSYHNDIVGRWEARANGKTGLNSGLLQNEVTLTDLAPFTINTTLSITSGVSDKPIDFIYRLALRISGKQCVTIRHDQIAAVNDSVLDAPSVTNNKYYSIEYEDYYSFLPNTVTAANLDYVASPEDIKWGYTLDAEGRQVYNPGTSVQPKWNNSTIITITKRALANLGISYKDADFLNFGRNAQNTGN